MWDVVRMSAMIDEASHHSHLNLAAGITFLHESTAIGGKPRVQCEVMHECNASRLSLSTAARSPTPLAFLNRGRPLYG